MTRRRKPTDYQPRTSWQQIFLQSRVNGGEYNGDSLPHHRRIWPKGFLEKRLEQIRREAR